MFYYQTASSTYAQLHWTLCVLQFANPVSKQKNEKDEKWQLARQLALCFSLTLFSIVKLGKHLSIEVYSSTCAYILN